MKGETLTFKFWDNIDFSFKQEDTEWYVSPRKKIHQLEEEASAKRLQIILHKLDEYGNVLGKEQILNLNEGDSLTKAYTFNESGNYIYEANLGIKNSAYKVFIKVMDPDEYKPNEEAIVKMRGLTPEELSYINKIIEPDISGNDYQLAMVADLKASYAWKKPADGGGPRSFMNSDGSVKHIDRFAPFNDYADHYVYTINDGSSKLSSQYVDNIRDYVYRKDTSYNMLPGPWVNHLDPLKNIQNEFNLGSRIQNITSTFVEDMFTSVITTYRDHYIVTTDATKGQVANTRNRRAYDITLPWGSLSKYHGFRLRSWPKSPVWGEKLKETILKRAMTRVGGGFDIHYVYGVYGFEKGSEWDIKFGMLDTDISKLEYRFFLNLKHNRWVIVPDDINKISFYHGSDQTNLIASYDKSKDKTLLVEAEEPSIHVTTRNTQLVEKALIGVGVGAAGVATIGVIGYKVLKRFRRCGGGQDEQQFPLLNMKKTN